MKPSTKILNKFRRTLLDGIGGLVFCLACGCWVWPAVELSGWLALVLACGAFWGLWVGVARCLDAASWRRYYADQLTIERRNAVRNATLNPWLS